MSAVDDAASLRERIEHADPQALPRVLAELHGLLVPGATSTFTVPTFEELRDVLAGAGFDVIALDDAGGGSPVQVTARRARTLPDFVAPRMRLLLCGLNPSLYSADAGVSFARPGNRFWPAALAAGIVSRPRDPVHALDHHHVGMTDTVKRATARADELSPEEYRAGVARVERLVRWLQPRVVCFVGMGGYRVAVDRRAVAGVQPEPFGGAPAYVMPNPSGINAHATPALLADHLRTAATLAGS